MNCYLRIVCRGSMRLALAVLFACILWPASTAAQRDVREVRAAYVFNLVKYVEWPANSSEILVAYLGGAESGAVMQRMLGGRSIDSHTIRVLVEPSLEDLARCNVVYIAVANESDERKLLDRVKDKNSLTIGESETFARNGGVISLVNTDDHIQLQVNLDAAQRAGVRISSRVLSLATIVHSAQNARN